MSSSISLRGIQLLPLWRRRVPKYPVYWKGDPQLRVFLPHFWMRMVKPEYDVPKNHAHFEVHPQMSKLDVKNYLEKIYKVPVWEVRSMTKRGEEIKHKTKNYVLAREEDQKFAYVVLDKSVEFEFPDIFSEKPRAMDKEIKEVNALKRTEMEEEQKSWERSAIPPWFR